MQRLSAAAPGLPDLTHIRLGRDADDLEVVVHGWAVR
jgi:hypothetical protein